MKKAFIVVFMAVFMTGTAIAEPKTLTILYSGNIRGSVTPITG